jgi:hypothetical protein
MAGKEIRTHTILAEKKKKHEKFGKKRKMF